MPQRADTPTQRRGLAPELAASPEAKPHRSCSASLSPSTLLSRASSASPSFIFSSKLLCSCGRARGRVRRTETSRNTCFLGLRCAAANYKHPGSRAGSAQPPRSTCGLFSPALNLHARDRQTDEGGRSDDRQRPSHSFTPRIRARHQPISFPAAGPGRAVPDHGVLILHC